MPARAETAGSLITPDSTLDEAGTLRCLGTSGLDLDGVQDRALLLEILGWGTGGPPGRDHQAGAFDVEDPELLGVAGTRVAVERVPRFRVDGRDPAHEVPVGASHEEPVVPLAFER